MRICILAVPAVALSLLTTPAMAIGTCSYSTREACVKCCNTPGMPIKNSPAQCTAQCQTIPSAKEKSGKKLSQ
jgi:hypothetical protein